MSRHRKAKKKLGSKDERDKRELVQIETALKAAKIAACTCRDVHKRAGLFAHVADLDEKHRVVRKRMARRQLKQTRHVMPQLFDDSALSYRP